MTTAERTRNLRREIAMAKKAAKPEAEKTKPEVVVREYKTPRQALEAVDCVTCGALAGFACVGRPNAAWPTGYPWPKSKVHARRVSDYKDR
jgi:hypothetical protein